MKIVAFVPIRLNSKRVPNKNLKLLDGKPLLSYVFDSLIRVNHIDEIYAYCSSDAIAQYLPSGVKLLKRPAYLDSDDILGEEIYDEFTKAVDADIYVLAHTTSPFIKSATIEGALSHIISGDNDSAFSCRRIQTFAWYDGKPLNYDLKHIPHTQSIRPVFEETSAFYIFKRAVWTDLHQRIGLNPYFAETSDIEAIDIDWPKDLEIAEKIIKHCENELDRGQQE
jgi:CMP-N-acetylneuraminic acid synthetase